MLPSINGLGFDADEFTRADFDVDKFVIRHKRAAPLESLQKDLATYNKALRNAVIEVVNEDYADFVNLSTCLVEVEQQFLPLESTVESVTNDVATTTRCLAQLSQDFETQTRDVAALRSRKSDIVASLNMSKMVRKLRQLLDRLGSETVSGRRETALLARLAALLADLQAAVASSQSCSVVVSQTEIIRELERAVLVQLEIAVQEVLQRPQQAKTVFSLFQVVQRCDRAEEVYAVQLVRPIVKLSMGPALDVAETLDKLLKFAGNDVLLMHRCLAGQSDIPGELSLRINVLANSFLPEVFFGFISSHKSFFSPADADVFHANYSIVMRFVKNVEALSLNEKDLTAIRCNPVFIEFMGKWNTAVYYQLRFHSIVSDFEHVLSTPANEVAPAALATAVATCWAPNVFLPPLAQRFWKLTLLLLHRYSRWLCQLSNASQEIPNGTTANHNGSSVVQISLLAELVQRSQDVVAQLEASFQTSLRELLPELSSSETSQLLTCLHDSLSDLHSALGDVEASAIVRLSGTCSQTLKSVSDVSKLYRGMNREMPSKRSGYIEAALKQMRVDSGSSNALESKWMSQALLNTLVNFHEYATEMLENVTKMEETRQRFSRRKTTGVGDETKIRAQVKLDIESFLEQTLEMWGDVAFSSPGYTTLRLLLNSLDKQLPC